MSVVVYTGGVIHSATEPFATAVETTDGIVSWVGDAETAAHRARGADSLIELDGAVVTPAFARLCFAPRGRGTLDGSGSRPAVGPVDNDGCVDVAADAGRLVDATASSGSSVADVLALWTDIAEREGAATLRRQRPILLVDDQALSEATWQLPAQLGHWGVTVVVSRTAETSPLGDVARWAGDGIAYAVTTARGVSPWTGVRSAVYAARASWRISARAAFLAHTRAIWRAADADVPGDVRVGLGVPLVAWRAHDVGVEDATEGKSSWSTDARAAVPLLPYVDAAGVLPALCHR